MLTVSEAVPLELKAASPYSAWTLYRLRTPGDGSCLIHAILKAYNQPYLTSRISDTNGQWHYFSQSDFVRKLRHELANLLSQPNAQGLTPYQTLSRGQWSTYSQEMPRYRLDALTALLDSSLPLDNTFNEFFSNVFDKDIYLFDLDKQDLYQTGKDASILYQGRPSIIILVIPGHYELVGRMKQGVIQTLFEPNDPLILQLRAQAS